MQRWRKSFLAVSVRAKSCTNSTSHTRQPVQREMIYNSIAKTDIIMQAMTICKTCTDGKYFPHCFIPSALFSPDTVTSCSTRQSEAFPSPSSPASPAPGLTHWSEGCSELQHFAAEDYSCLSIIPTISHNVSYKFNLYTASHIMDDESKTALAPQPPYLVFHVLLAHCCHDDTSPSPCVQCVSKPKILACQHSTVVVVEGGAHA